MSIVRGALEERSKGAAGRVGAQLDASLGPTVNPVQKVRELVKTRRETAGPIYKKAYAESGPVDTSDVMLFLDSEITSAKGDIKAALINVRSLLHREGSLGKLNERDLNSLHQSKMAIDDMISWSGKTKAGIGNVAEGKIKQARGKLLDAMDLASPDYKAARKIWSSDSSAMDAFDEGRKAFQKKPHKTEVADFMEHATAAERDAYREGARLAIADAMEANMNGARSAGVNFEKKPVGKEKLQIIFGEGANDVSEVLERENKYFGLNATVVGNSETARRTAAGKLLDKPPGILGGKVELGGIASGASGAARGAAMSAIDAALAKGRGRKIGEGNAAIARALIATGSKRDEILARLVARQSAPGVDPARQALAEALLFGGGTPTATRSLKRREGR